jgi:DNA replication protein DnaC
MYIQEEGSSTLYVEECVCHERWRNRNIFNIRAHYANIWPEAIDYSLGDYKGDKSIHNVVLLQNYVKNFEKLSYAMSYLYGPNGTQKTTVAQWIGAQLIKKGYTVKFLHMQKLSKVLSDFTRGKVDMEEANNLENEYLNVDLLIVDESFSKDKVTLYQSGFQIPHLDRFLRERFEMKKKGIMFISNNPCTNIAKEGFGESLQDLISRNVLMQKTHLEFLDNYTKIMSMWNPEGIFE